jgi:hypothetical protein
MAVHEFSCQKHHLTEIRIVTRNKKRAARVIECEQSYNSLQEVSLL